MRFVVKSLRWSRCYQSKRNGSSQAEIVSYVAPRILAPVLSALDGWVDRISGGLRAARRCRLLFPNSLKSWRRSPRFSPARVAEAQARAEAQHREWDEESRRRREEQERAKQAKLRQEAKDDLLVAIDARGTRARRVQEWLALVEREIQELAEVDRQQVGGRLEQARELVGGADALDLLRKWKAPGERQ
jgi:hypothetical protein